MSQSYKNKKRPKQVRKWPFLAVAGLLMVILLYVALAHSKALWPFSPKPVSDPNAEQQQTVNVSPKNNNPAKTAPASTDENKTSDQVPESTTLTATINQARQSGDNVEFSAQVANSSSAGTCVVTFTNVNDRPITKQVDAVYKAGTSLCGPLTIPTYEFSYLGEWDVTLHYYENSQQATASTKVTIQ